GLFLCPARQNERSLVVPNERMITPLGAKTEPALRVAPEKRHSALLVAHLEQPNHASRALIGAFSSATGRIGLVLTGPN
ncbi:MAG: hypothetical protein JAY64_19660, partial [Candidatus Thiodiazotropha weberae]|nr:hypothetical protein [Candidatus Thiodiazotropha lotti]MCW4213376.1 hypothetical protein [Candidatus Thiodiazotropha lotti]